MKKFRLFVSLVVGSCSVVLAHAIFVTPSYLPIDRLVSNTKELIRENPENDEAYYTLARIYYLGFANKSDLIPAQVSKLSTRPLPYWRNGGTLSYFRREAAKDEVLKTRGLATEDEIEKADRPAFWDRVREVEREMIESNWEPVFEDSARLAHYASEAFELFGKAIEIAPNSGLYQLGLASLLEQSCRFSEEHEALPLEFASFDAAKNAYWKAYELSIDSDLTTERKPVGGLSSLVAYEASKSFLRLAQESESEGDLQKVAEMSASLEIFGKLPRGPITPIVFSLDGAFPLLELEDLDAEVVFDLDGDGVAKKWSWVQADTGILVWDPEGLGQIDSGRQLFGSVTWWVFFSDGFQALGLLDDDRDGTLRGLELEGLSVWFDVNQNAVSDSGEVMPIQSVGISAISTQGNDFADGVVFNRLGLELKDGRRLPVYDWLATPKE